MKRTLPLIFAASLLLLLTSCRPTYQKMNAWEQAHALKESILLVPLSDPGEQVGIYEQYGQHRRARKLRKKYDKQNGKIIEAFASRWDYCPVYFYYLSDENRILNQGRRDLFLNQGLVRDASIAPNLQQYFLAEFEPITQWQGDATRETIALVIKDTEYRALSAPFPNAEKVNSFSSRSSLNSSVKTLNYRLNRFYERRNDYLARQ
ncbi:MAG: hypothetical protein H6581_16920 [Bacteroidia bacterium]|nr:hypothetical protein [Bacteroidia bacterium]